MKNVKIFDGQVVSSEDLNNMQSYKADEIKKTRLDVRTYGIIPSESHTPYLVYVEGKRLGIYYLSAMDKFGERIVVSANGSPNEPVVKGLLPDETGKLVPESENYLATQSKFTLVIRRTTVMEGPLCHHATTGKQHLITENDSWELYIRDFGGAIEGDIILATITTDISGYLTIDESVADVSYIKADEVAALDSNGNIVTFPDHINQVGSGDVTPTNPHGLTAYDLGIDVGELSQHQALLHTDGIRTDNVLSTYTALYPYYRRENRSSNEVVYIRRLDPPNAGNRELLIANGKTFSTNNAPSLTEDYEFNFQPIANDMSIGYYLFYFDTDSASIAYAGPCETEKHSSFTRVLNNKKYFPICSFKLATVIFDETGEGVADEETRTFDIMPGTWKDLRKFQNLSLSNIHPDEVSAISQFAPYCNDRAYIHNARLESTTNSAYYYVSGKTLQITVDETVDTSPETLSVTFSGGNPLATQDVIDQMKAAFTAVDSEGYAYLKVNPRQTSSGTITLSAPCSIRIRTAASNDASSILGFTSGANNLYNTSELIKELIYVGERNGIVLFTYDEDEDVTTIEYLLGGGLRRYNTFTYKGTEKTIVSVKEGIEPL